MKKTNNKIKRLIMLYCVSTIMCEKIGAYILIQDGIERNEMFRNIINQ